MSSTNQRQQSQMLQSRYMISIRRKHVLCTCDLVKYCVYNTCKSEGNYFLKNSNFNLLTGDPRVNQQPALISLQTIWHREHNRIAKKLKTVNPEWNDETLFQESRKIVGAMIQHITYHSYLQEILGNDIMNKFDLKPKTSEYFTGYNANFKAMIRNVFSTAAFRFGHSMINDKLSYHPIKAFSTNIMSDLKNIVLKPDWIYRKDGGVGAVTKGLYETNAQSVDM